MLSPEQRAEMAELVMAEAKFNADVAFLHEKEGLVDLQQSRMRIAEALETAATALANEAALTLTLPDAARQAAENARKAAAFDHIASLKTEWSGHCCNGKGEYTFIPDVEAFEPYEPTECASAPTLLEAVEMTMAKEADRG